MIVRSPSLRVTCATLAASANVVAVTSGPVTDAVPTAPRAPGVYGVPRGCCRTALLLSPRGSGDSHTADGSANEELAARIRVWLLELGEVEIGGTRWCVVRASDHGPRGDAEQERGRLSRHLLIERPPRQFLPPTPRGT